MFLMLIWSSKLNLLKELRITSTELVEQLEQERQEHASLSGL